MGYPNPLGGITRQLTNTSIILHSCKFSRVNIMNFGGRCAVIRIPNTNKIVVWNPLPDGPEFENCLKSSVDGEFEVIANIVPDREHTMATGALKAKYPKSVSIGPTLLPNSTTPVDYTFTDSMANKIFKIEDESVPKEVRDNFEFIYVTGHVNKELVMFDKINKALIEADLMFNIPRNGVSEQYPEGGQNSSLSYITRFMNSESSTGRWIVTKGMPVTPETCSAMKQILSWDFDKIIMSHGDVIESNAKAKFKEMFQAYL